MDTQVNEIEQLLFICVYYSYAPEATDTPRTKLTIRDSPIHEHQREFSPDYLTFYDPTLGRLQCSDVGSRIMYSEIKTYTLRQRDTLNKLSGISGG